MSIRLKLDENLGRRGQLALRRAGHDVETVVDEGLMSAPDAEVAAHSLAEGRALVTLDLDFADPRRFPPQGRPGIAVLRLPAHAGPDDLAAAVERLIVELKAGSIWGKLWVVEPDRLRVHTPASR